MTAATPPPTSPPAAALDPAAAKARRAAARDLLERARNAMIDADALARAGGSLAGTALRACDATHLAARALLAADGLDRSGPPETALLFAMRLVATERISRAAGEAAQRALRARRECSEADPVVLYEARVESLRQGARLLLEEADIVLGRGLAAPAPGAKPGVEEDEEALP